MKQPTRTGSASKRSTRAKRVAKTSSARKRANKSTVTRGRAATTSRAHKRATKPSTSALRKKKAPVQPIERRAPRRLMPPLAIEMSSADFDDARLSKRAGRIVSGLMDDPSASLPDAMGDDAGLEALYRFLGNKAVTPERILAPHIAATCFRAAAEGTVLAIHDTSECQFSGNPRAGLGRLSGPGTGFFAHVTLLASADGSRRPLGVVNLHTHVRGKRKTRKQREASKRRVQPDNEGRRWYAGIDAASERVAGRARVIHVIDREGDSYGLLGHLHGKEGEGFVVRASHNRSVETKDPLGAPSKLFTVVAAALPMVEREVFLSPRQKAKTPKERRVHPPRAARTAMLSFAATTVEVKRSKYVRQQGPKSMTLNVVRVFEPYPPDGEEAVEWLLWTNLPIGTVAQVVAIIDIYRARWLIEELFKALKTGCNYERRQLESGKTLLNALAILLPIAWHMLRLRSLARHEPLAPASLALTPTQLEVLDVIARRPLPAQPSVRDAMLAVAALGGHIKNNGEPGWLVLYRGMRDLFMAELGWIAARSCTMPVDKKRCDR